LWSFYTATIFVTVICWRLTGGYNHGTIFAEKVTVLSIIRPPDDSRDSSGLGRSNVLPRSF